MTEGEALFAAILDSPEEDAPRLIYADWLEDTGDSPQAEFIRVQIELARLEAAPRHLQPETAVALRAREQTLQTTFGEKWLAPLRQKGAPLERGCTHVRFRRGFVEVVWMQASRFLSHAERLFASCPARELRVVPTRSDEMLKLFSCPFLRKLDCLDTSHPQLGELLPRIILGSYFAWGLQTLRLRACNITDEGAFHLARVPFDRPLRELDLAFNPIGPGGLAILEGRFGSALKCNNLVEHRRSTASRV